MSDIIEIYPKRKWQFKAYKFAGEETRQLLGFTLALEQFELELIEEDGKYFLDGNTPDDTMEIKPGEYFVTCGPYWDVRNSTEIMDDFVIG